MAVHRRRRNVPSLLLFGKNKSTMGKSASRPGCDRAKRPVLKVKHSGKCLNVHLIKLPFDIRLHDSNCTTTNISQIWLNRKVYESGRNWTNVSEMSSETASVAKVWCEFVHWHLYVRTVPKLTLNTELELELRRIRCRTLLWSGDCLLIRIYLQLSLFLIFPPFSF